MRCFRNPMSSFLHRSATFVNHGTICGSLYDLGPYPGAIVEKTSTHFVHGEIFKIYPDKSIKVLEKLDVYEGIVGVASDEYRRELHPVKSGGTVIQCWVYVLNSIPEPAMIISSGRYID